LESRFVRLVALLGLAAVFAGFLGCGGTSDDLPRQAVSGTVTFDGQPLAEGRIQFEPASAEARTPAGGEIKDGQYSIPRHQGPTPGDYRIMITSSAARTPPADKSPGAEPPKGVTKKQAPAVELIPKEYNSQTKLTAKVEAGKSNSFEFPLNK
jgi:hypothetical protein